MTHGFKVSQPGSISGKSAENEYLIACFLLVAAHAESVKSGKSFPWTGQRPNVEDIMPNDVSFLITGSREAYSRRLLFAKTLARQLIERGIRIIVGDAPGVDGAVVEEANAAKYKNIQVVGAYKRMRCQTNYGENFPLDMTYPARDFWMARRCTHCLGIWDKQSRGTAITFNAALKLRRKVRVVTIVPGYPAQWWRGTKPNVLVSLVGSGEETQIWRA